MLIYEHGTVEEEDEPGLSRRLPLPASVRLPLRLV